MVERAAAAGYEAIILTVDTAVLGRRERDIAAGSRFRRRSGRDTIVDGIVHPGVDVRLHHARADDLRQRRASHAVRHRR